MERNGYYAVGLWILAISTVIYMYGVFSTSSVNRLDTGLLPLTHFTSKHKLSSDSYGMPTHYYSQRGMLFDNDNTPCLQSVEKCLDSIQYITGVKPQLISFSKNTPQQSHHNKTGEPFLVPNIIHYINFDWGQQPFQFFHYVSYKGVDKFLRPSMIILWGNKFGNNTLWRRMLREVPNLYNVDVITSTMLFGVKFWWVQHLSDVLRIAVLRGEIVSAFHWACMVEIMLIQPTVYIC